MMVRFLALSAPQSPSRQACYINIMLRHGLPVRKSCGCNHANRLRRRPAHENWIGKILAEQTGKRGAPTAWSSHQAISKPAQNQHDRTARNTQASENSNEEPRRPGLTWTVNRTRNAGSSPAFGAFYILISVAILTKPPCPAAVSKSWAPVQPASTHYCSPPARRFR